jgi:hypothetical protein
MKNQPLQKFRRDKMGEQRMEREMACPEKRDGADAMEELLKQVVLAAHSGNEPVTVKEIPPSLRVVGVGTDATVVWHPDRPKQVFKVYAEGRLEKKEREREVYRRLGESPRFCRCFGEGPNYLILSYEEGPTLYECLEQGIFIPEQVIADVEEARLHAREKGLNPRDIHLKNVILQNGRAKLVDLSEFLLPGDDHRWDHLVQAYHDFYPLIQGRKIPAWLLEWVKKSYYAQASSDFSVQEFGRRFIRLFT